MILTILIAQTLLISYISFSISQLYSRINKLEDKISLFNASEKLRCCNNIKETINKLKHENNN